MIILQENEILCDCRRIYPPTSSGKILCAEAVIATDPHESYYYARDTIRGQWLPGEAAIATSADYSLAYARYVIKGRWPQSKQTDVYISYAMKVSLQEGRKLLNII